MVREGRGEVVPILDVVGHGAVLDGSEDLTFTGVRTATIQSVLNHYTDCAVQVTITMYYITEM